MVLKLADRPRLLSLNAALRNQTQHDPYRVVSKLLLEQKYDKFAQILKRKAPVRHTATIPTILLHSSNKATEVLYQEMHARQALPELIYCVRIAQSLAREYHDKVPSALERIALQDDGASRVLTDLPYAEFEHFYQVYRYAARPTRA